MTRVESRRKRWRKCHSKNWMLLQNAEHVIGFLFSQPTAALHVDTKRRNEYFHSKKARVPELIPVLGSQPAGFVSHKPGGRLPLLSARPAVTPATLKRAATNFAAW